MAEKYVLERDGQIDFYNTFLPRINSDLTTEDIISDNNDGVINGNIIEFKLHVNNLNATLYQTIKYLSSLRIKGKPVPANILIVDLNASIAWLYKSEDYLKEIETVYVGAASKDNEGFSAKNPIKILHYDKIMDTENLIALLKENNHTKIHIDENCIVGWATTFYREVPGARKEDFLGDDTGKHKKIGEIRKPVYLKDFIHPYRGKSNVKFNYLMDRLNDTLQKKNLGAFYTHSAYAEKSLELVRLAIDRVPVGNDYIILDRCAGTGNLEAKLTDEELSHCVVSTVEYYEYKVLQELFGSKVRHIIPPIEKNDTFNMGLVTGADALSEDFVTLDVIKKYVDDPNCNIILFENPPYSETSSIEHQKKKAGKSSNWKKSYIMQQMRNDKYVKGSAYNDLGNLFIWSGFKYYLRKPEDSYIVYSPVKYWKAQSLIDKRFIKGFAFNRRHFHTNINACIMCALWSAEDAQVEEFNIEAFDIDKNGNLMSEGMLPIKRIHSSFSQKLYDKRIFDDDVKGGIYCEFDGKECGPNRSSVRIRPITNNNIIAYLAVKGANFDNPDSSVHLLRVGAYDANGFYIRDDDFLSKLPMFCASRYITYNRQWTERARIMKSADKAKQYQTDIQKGMLNKFLIKCLIFTCLEMQNHCRSFTGTDGIYYRNELSLDNSNGDTLACKKIKTSKLDAADKKMLKAWDTVMFWAKKCKEYNKLTTYGLYQIFTDLDTSYVDEETGNIVWNYVELHSALQVIKNLIKEYYNSEIVPMLFKYELLK